jgi:Cu/Ag efflux pump CusA
MLRRKLRLMGIGILALILIGSCGSRDKHPIPVTVEIEVPSTLPTQAVDDTVTSVLEEGLKNLPGLAHIRSHSSRGLARSKIEFRAGTDRAQARQAVAERLGAIAGKLPKAVERPLLSPAGIELTRYVLISKDLRFSSIFLENAQDELIRRELLSIPGVTDVVVAGGARRLEVAFDADRLLRMGITPAQLQKAVAESPIKLPRNGPAQAVENLLITKIQEQPVLVRDVARVLSTRTFDTEVTLDGQECAEAVVLRRPDSDGPSVLAAVKAKVEQIQKHQGYPEGVRIVPYAEAPIPAGGMLLTPRQQTLWVEGYLPDSASREQAISAAHRTLALIRALPGVARVVSHADADEVTNTGGRFAICVQLSDDGVRHRTLVNRSIRDATQAIPEAIVLLRAIEPDPGWPFRTADDEVLALISSEDGGLTALSDAAEGLKQKLSKIAGVQDVALVSGRMSLDLLLRIDQDRCKALGIDPEDVRALFDTSALGLPVGPTFSLPFEGGGAVQLIVRRPRDQRMFFADRIENVHLVKDGKRIPLRALAEVRTVFTPASITRQDGRRVTAVRFAVRGTDAAKVLAEAKKVAEGYVAKAYRVDWSR